jgi:DNA-directed RNA polymerase subunit RPC12/RpoP
MALIGRYRSAIEAQSAAALLKSHGIIARVVGETDLLGGISGLHLIVDDHDESKARMVLRAFADAPVDLEEGWESQAERDPSRLGAQFAPSCPGCQAVLPLDASLSACSECGREVDVVGLIVDQFGPEALIDESGPEVSEETLESAGLRCPACGYGLRGLPAEGFCPECGRRYRKQDLYGSL